ncbi:hypothetical protein [Nostoc sp. 'Peltigera membranacea cyanobiont' 210A]|uniref:hypothetical protein n=1 Tax=Nostoc sp. 'Peltigera membranacea cyanobiont' 210A TaxID=2014529 RepID=UPI00167D7F0E|nr:hypothetical protein [Nostoc sp. 'Peltigera membranacea cyanobiont' 210A]
MVLQLAVMGDRRAIIGVTLVPFYETLRERYRNAFDTPIIANSLAFDFLSKTTDKFTD